MQHANAPLIRTGRLRMVLLVVDQGFTFEAAAAASNVAKSTVWVWVDRWREAGDEDRASLTCLEDRPSRPRTSPGQVPAVEAERICARRERTGWSPRRLADEPDIARPHSTVHQVLRRGGCSRLAYSEIHDDEKAATVTAFTRRALDWFLDHGIVGERLMTDNAFTYVLNRSLRELLTARRIQHIRTRPYTPRANGKVERFNQTLQREWAYALEYASSDARREALPHWIDHYNERRTHTALSNRPPRARVRNVLGHNT